MSVVRVGSAFTEGVAVTFDLRRNGIYTSAECQLGAHHGCPGGLRETGGAQALVCDCPAISCDCCRPLSCGPADR
ncbi:hypothetical protein GCM10009664_65890 [Kitasatospora gansuensis]